MKSNKLKSKEKRLVSLTIKTDIPNLFNREFSGYKDVTNSSISLFSLISDYLNFFLLSKIIDSDMKNLYVINSFGDILCTLIQSLKHLEEKEKDCFFLTNILMSKLVIYWFFYKKILKIMDSTEIYQFLSEDTEPEILELLISELFLKAEYFKDKFISYKEDVLRNLSQYENNVKPNEFWWYHVCLIYFFREERLQECHIRNLIDCARHIKEARDPRYKTAIFCLIKYGIDEIESYLSDELFPSLIEVYSDISRYCEGMYAKARHQFVKKNLKSNFFFEYRESLKANPEFFSEQHQSCNKEFELNADGDTNTIFSTSKITIKLSLLSLFKFAAHIFPPSPPIPFIRIPWLNEKEVSDFNFNLQKRLREIGVCDSQGFLQRRSIKEKWGLIVNEIVALLEKEKFNTHKYTRNSILQCVKSAKVRSKLDSDIKEIVNLRKLLGFFSPLDALVLFYTSMVSQKYINISTHDIRSILFNTIGIALKAREINYQEKNNPDEKQKKFFDLAGEIVGFLKQFSRQSLVIQVGTPIRNHEKSSSHAIYCVIKRYRSTNYRVIIVNGGDECSTYHKLANCSSAGEQEEYHYAAFKSFKLNPDNSAALKHYIYHLISLQYTNANSSERYKQLLDDLYLNQDNDLWYFHDFSSKKCYRFKREDNIGTFYSQLHANCTIHNLKYALKVLFDMNGVEFGKLVDISLLGFDNFLNCNTPFQVDNPKGPLENLKLSTSKYTMFPSANCGSRQFKEIPDKSVYIDLSEKDEVLPISGGFSQSHNALALSM